MLEIKDLSLWHEDNKKVLDNISMEIADGECILLTGESGGGKSSIINSINGLIFSYENAQSTGSIKVNGKEIKDLQLYEISLLIASVFQNPKTHFFNVNTTLELLFYLENIGLTRDDMDLTMKEMLKIFHIKHLLERSIFDLSGGEKQILCVASCYISGCKVIVLDEPSSNLDEMYIDFLKEMLKVLKDKQITLILAEHRIYYLMDLVDRIYFIKSGKLDRIFTKVEFLSLERATLTEWGIRSRYRTVLKKNRMEKGKALLIKKMEVEFEDERTLSLENVGFDLGRIYGIVGRNGCGKSTFLRVMTGLERKDKSEIFYHEKKLNRKGRLNSSALVMQDVNHQLFAVSVEEEVKLGAKDLKQDKVDKVLNDLGLSMLRDRHPMSLSGGEKQRVAIASVLCKNSRFIYFDEPTSGMDHKNMLKISKLIKEMITDDNIIFIVSHDTEFLNKTTDFNFCLEEHTKAKHN